jgi:predicted membrane channel-forming protein YqfA (hemolysin III family)
LEIGGVILMVDGGPSYRLFWVGLIINFVSPLFSKVEAMFVFLLFLGIVLYTLGKFFVVLLF